MKKLAIAASSVALAAMPVVGVFALDTDDTQVVDTIQVTVQSSCTFRATDGGASSADTTYTATGVNGAPVSPANSGSSTHTFNVFCNNNKGYTVTATANDLVAATTTPAITDTFAYKNALSQAAGDNGEWHAEIASSAEGVVAAQLPNSTSGSANGTIITRATGATPTAGDAWTATYSALIGTKTTAATYSGTITYNLAQTQ